MSLNDEFGRAIRHSSLLSELPEQMAGELLSLAMQRSFEPGDWIIEEGQPSDSVFILGPGRTSILKQGTQIDEQADGGVIGEMGVLTSQPRTASVRAESEITAWCLPSGSFMEFVDAHPSLLRALVGELSSKLQMTHAGRVESNRSVDILKRCVSEEVLDRALLKNKPEDLLMGQENPAAILFFDIKGFSTAAEQMEPQELLQNLNEHVGEITESVSKYEGTVVNFIGDAVLAVFNAPIPLERPSEEAFACFMECKERLDSMRESRKEEGKFSFDLGAGLNYGQVVSGAMGTAKRFSYTVLGDEVNLTARLEGLTRYYPVDLILSQAVYEHLPEGQKSLCFLLDRVRVKGRETPVDIYSVLGGLTGRQDAYAGALQAYLKGDFDSAASTFGSLGHPLGEYMKERCEGLASGGEDWMGYYSFSVK